MDSDKLNLVIEKQNEVIEKHNELCRLLQDMNLNPLADFNNLEVDENDLINNIENIHEQENTEEEKEQTEKPKVSF